MREKETDIVRAICDYLALRKHFFWRQNTAPLYREGRFFSMPKYAMRGVPDIIVIKDGRFIGLEVKRKGAKQSVWQKQFQILCEENEAAYFVVRNIDETKALGL